MEKSTGSSIERWSEEIRQEWTALVPFWRKSSTLIASFWKAQTEALIEAVGARPGLQILDLACGTGEPALPLARAVGPSGRSTATDLVPEMVTACEENAREQGLTNVTCQQADAQSLPFPDQCFDVVTCRFGIMYVPDAARALSEIRRVLKPGGRAVFTVWATPDPETGIPDPLAPLAKHAEYLKKPDPGGPHMHKFSEPGSLARELKASGFREVQEETRTVMQSFPGTPEQYWESFREAAAPLLEPIFRNISEEEASALVGEITAVAGSHYDGQSVNVPGVFTLVWATR
jgi:ubiquinone/menaquinone biosynthesis C-methylase UbiE